MKIKTFQIIAFLCITIIASGQNRQDKDLIKQVDRSVSETYRDFTPGCAILIAKKGEIILQKGYGTANLELNVAMHPDMVFRIGSVTKQFTAVAILQLVDNGLISLTDNIEKFVAGFNTKGKTITIENLLTHTSGIRGYEQLDAKIPNAIRIDFSTQTVIDSLGGLSLEFEPGTQYNYSNSNYYLLGYIIEKVTGKSYPQYLKENVLAPAGLNSTYYENYTQIIPGRVNGYSFSDGNYRNADFISMSLVFSAGALSSNVGDLFKWHQALYSNKLLKKETFLKAITPYKLLNGEQTRYGYGFFTGIENGYNAIGHAGAIDGFRAREIYYPEQDIFIAVLCNSNNDGNDQIFQNVANIVLGNQPAQSTEIALSNETLDSYTGTFRNEKYNLSIKIYRTNGRLYADLSNGTGSNLMFKALSETKFYLPDIKRVKTTAEFIKENGKVIKLIMTQEQPVTFIKAD